MVDEVETLPADGLPCEGEVWNYNGQNYEVVAVDPDSLVLGQSGWEPAILFKDKLNEDAGELTSDLRYVMPVELFTLYYELGEVDEDKPVDDNPWPPSPPRPVAPDGEEEPDAEPKDE